MDTLQLFDPMFWEDAWYQAAKSNESNINPQAVIHWNQRAQNYDGNTASASGSKRVQAALNFLQAYGIFKERMRILDIGCGPGSFTAFFAELGHDVVALDPAEEMLRILQKKIEGQPHLKERITPVLADWVPLSLEEYGWNGYFDLVFASMTPGIHNPATLNKAIEASSKYVYVSQFAGPRKHVSVNDLWLHLQGSPYFKPGQDLLLPLVWLYTNGYRPVVDYSQWERDELLQPTEAVTEISTALSARMHIDKKAELVIREYVAANTDKDGFFKETKGATSAMLLFRADKKCLVLGG